MHDTFTVCSPNTNTKMSSFPFSKEMCANMRLRSVVRKKSYPVLLIHMVNSYLIKALVLSKIRTIRIEKNSMEGRKKIPGENLVCELLFSVNFQDGQTNYSEFVTMMQSNNSGLGWQTMESSLNVPLREAPEVYWCSCLAKISFSSALHGVPHYP